MPPRRHEPSIGQLELPGQELHPALVHVLTSDFQLIDPTEYADIPDGYVPYVHPDALRGSLLDVPPLNPDQNHAVVSYQPAESSQWKRLTVTSAEFTLFARHVPMLAETALQGVFHSRDQKIQKETGNPAAQARSSEDWAAARRAAMRQVMKKGVAMEQHLEGELRPRILLINQFQEMTKYPNLARGTSQSMRERVRYLHDYVFGDMLKAIGNLREWDTDQTALASRTLQKKLYLDPVKSRRITSFGATVTLAQEYYGHKQAFVLSRIAEVRKYMRTHPDVLENIRATDAAREELSDV